MNGERYSDEFKAEAAKQVIEHGRDVPPHKNLKRVAFRTLKRKAGALGARVSDD